MEKSPNIGRIEKRCFSQPKGVASQTIKKTNRIITGKGRILLVDDEEILTIIVKRMLELLCYQVTTKNCSLEALKTFQQSPEDFDVVITDQTIPNLTGLELAIQMLEIRPDIPIILCTGFSKTVTKQSAQEVGIREFLMKPLRMEPLGKLLHNILDTI